MGCGGSTSRESSLEENPEQVSDLSNPELTQQHGSKTTVRKNSTEGSSSYDKSTDSRSAVMSTSNHISRMSTFDSKVAKVSASSVIPELSMNHAELEKSHYGASRLRHDSIWADRNNTINEEFQQNSRLRGDNSRLWEDNSRLRGDEKLLTEPEYEQVHVSDELSEYPPPVPPQNKSADVINRRDIMTADFTARKVKAESYENMKDLVKSLTGHLVNDLSKARAIYVWIGNQRINSRTFPESTTSGNPLDYLKLLSLQQMSFAAMFTMMCREANIRCVIIRGVAKSSAYNVGDQRLEGLRNAWCSVFVAGGWRFVFPLWGLSVMEGRKILIERKGARYGGHEDLPVTYGSNSVDEYYFLTEPKELAYFCFPDNKKWQLLKKPISKETFISVPYLRPEYFIHKLKITTKFEGVLTAEIGQCNVGIKPTGGMKFTDVSYEFVLNESKQDIPSLQKYVAIMNMNSKETLFKMRFPFVGTYEFRVLDGDHALVCSFKIICNTPMPECVPYPMSSVFGFGPCQETRDSGLRPESHTKGVIIIGKSRSVNVRFTMDKVLSVQATLIHNILSSNELRKTISQTVERDTVTFCVDLPSVGEYGLQIYSREYSSSEPYRNVCNYLLVHQNPHRKQRQWENAEEKITRKKFLHILNTSNDTASIRKAMERFLELGLEDKEAVQRAKDRIEYIKIAQGLHDGILSRNLEKLDTAVTDATASKHSEILGQKILEAEELIAHLMKLRRFAHEISEMKQTTVSEIHRYIIPKPVVFDVMKATFFLLGEKLKHIEYWENIQALMREKGERSLINRIRKFDTVGVDKNTAVTALKWLTPYDKSTATAVSCATATFYVWVVNIGRDVLGTENYNLDKKSSS